MINLTPIHQKIQKRMFEKMRVLGRANPATPKWSTKGILTHDKMATRSTFLRMTSGQLNPVVLMGGKLQEGFDVGLGGIPSGFDEIYGQRTYMTPTYEGIELTAEDIQDIGNFAEQRVLSNKNKRPTPGLKSIDASFKGGLRALREATINWTCWDWKELDYLMPHFLAHGKTVMVEWGWVYDKQSMLNLPNFLEYTDNGHLFISADAYSNYKNLITDADGDFDMMVGIIKNFEFTTRDDGGFDCQTILTSVGASIMEASEPNESAKDPSITYNLSINEDTRDTADKIAVATGLEGVGKNLLRTDRSPAEKNPLINLNTSVSLKLFIKEIDKYIQQTLISDKQSEGKNLKWYLDETNHEIRWIGNKFLAIRRKGHKGVNDITPKKAWVRWGWFEDNILSKFLSVTSTPNAKTGDASYNPIITEFRSIEKKLKSNSDESGKYESVRIKNNPEFQTMNINHFIVPGQIYPQELKSFIIEKDKDPVKLDGDKEYLHKLREVTIEHFDAFAAPSGKTVTEIIDIYDNMLTTENLMDDAPKEGFDADFSQPAVERKKIGEKSVTRPAPTDEGYLRNLLINTKLLKQAFGVDGEDAFTVESINVVEAIESLFSLLNQELNFWNFNITVDETETHRAKIVDEQITNFDFKTSTLQQRSISLEDGTVGTSEGNDEGVFFFPVWQPDSMVKRQNITAKIPDAMQLAVMYGSNVDSLKDFANPGSQFADKEGVVAGGLFNESLDAHKGGLDIAYRNTNTRKIGVKHGKKEKGGFIDDASTPLRPAAGDDIEQFLTDNAGTLEEAFESRLKTLNKKLKVSDKTIEAQLLSYDESVPPPFPSMLTDTELKNLLKSEKDREGIFGLGEGDLTGLMSSVFHDTGEMKARFKKSVNYLTTQHGKYKQANTPLLIPLELELDIDGIGGVYPGNSFHSTYVPSKYQKATVFQIFDVNHKLSDTGWTVTLSGKMRATMGNIFQGYKSLKSLKEGQIEAYLERAIVQEKAAVIKEAVDEAVFTATIQPVTMPGAVIPEVATKVAAKGLYKVYKWVTGKN